MYIFKSAGKTYERRIQGVDHPLAGQIKVFFSMLPKQGPGKKCGYFVIFYRKICPLVLTNLKIFLLGLGRSEFFGLSESDLQ